MKFKLWLESFDDWLKQYELFEPTLLADPLVRQDLSTIGYAKPSTIDKVLRQHNSDLGAGLTGNTFNKRHQNLNQQSLYQKQQDEADLRARRDGFYYHVLPKNRLRIVMREGLIPGKSPVFTNYTNHSQGRIFLCEKEGVDFWKQRVEEHLFHNGQNQKVSVVRIPKTIVSVLPDEVGTQDSRTPSYYTTQSISPENIQIV